MPPDRITQLSIEGMRCIESVRLDLKELTVLIGENGTGKSTIIEALELLRKAATEAPLVPKLYQHHDGLRLLRSGATHLELSATIEGEAPALTYSIRFFRDGTYLRVASERLSSRGHTALMERNGDRYAAVPARGIEGDIEGVASTDEALLAHARFMPIPQFARVQAAFAAIEVHTALDLRRSWSHAKPLETARSSNLVRPADRLEPGGTNLVNVFASLKNQKNWRETLGRLRVALGEIDDVLLVSEPSGGSQSIFIRWGNGLEVPLSGLSDGQVSVLALVSIQQVQRATPPSIVALDEPEIHLHPGLVARVAIGLQEMAEGAPVLVGTQSDAFLNAIERPEDSVVLCQLDEQRRARLLRPDREHLRDWLTEFKGLGAMRSEGLQGVAFPAEQ